MLVQHSWAQAACISASVAQRKWKIKLFSDSKTETGDANLTQRESDNNRLLSRLGYMVNLMHELSQSTVPVGSSMDNVIKVATRLYGALSLVTKYVSKIKVHTVS